ncbi:hypothetical protein D018_0663 [Vibrio parahaemolyticus VP2007-007]|nr:hypothetical protein D018_0663 [Vibrio parahaemolyticus VP2007-007]
MSGLRAFGPTINSVDTGTSSNSGCVAICATMICIASQCGNKCLGTPIAAIGP